jgi:hypothetical protein
MEPHKLDIDDLNNLFILNYELKSFLHNIVNTITYFIDEDELVNNNNNYGVTINFIYNNYSFDLYNDYEVRKLSILNKKTHHYEFFYENHEEILINKCFLKTVSIDEMYDLFKDLFIYIKNKS